MYRDGTEMLVNALVRAVCVFGQQLAPVRARHRLREEDDYPEIDFG